MSASPAPAVLCGPATGASFGAFPSISGTRSADHLRKIAPDVCASGEWIGVEKVHGSNFSVTYSEESESVQFGSRTQYLTNSFFGHVTVMQPYLPSLLALARHFRATRHGVRVQVFGELFGGHYPGVGGSAGAAVQMVNAVHYCPQVDFKAFDVFVAGEPINRDEMLALFVQHSVPHLKPRARGTLAELLAMDPAFESEVYREYGLPAIDGNKAEGMVLQPVVPLTVLDDDEPVRVMLKHKNETHTERTVKSAKAPKPAAPKDLPPLSSHPPALQSAVEQAVSYVTLARLGNYFSKVGISSRALVASGLVQDAFVDLIKEATAEEKALITKNQRVVRPFMNKEANAVIDAYIAQVKATGAFDPGFD